MTFVGNREFIGFTDSVERTSLSIKWIELKAVLRWTFEIRWTTRWNEKSIVHDEIFDWLIQNWKWEFGGFFRPFQWVWWNEVSIVHDQLFDWLIENWKWAFGGFFRPFLLSQARIEWRIPIIYHANTDDRLSIIPVFVSLPRDQSPPSDPDHPDSNDHNQASNLPCFGAYHSPSKVSSSGIWGHLMGLVQFRARSRHPSRLAFVPFAPRLTLPLSPQSTVPSDGVLCGKWSNHYELLNISENPPFYARVG
jgi:hypothetical protein